MVWMAQGKAPGLVFGILCGYICIVSNMAFVMGLWICGNVLGTLFGDMVPVCTMAYGDCVREIVPWQEDAVAGQFLWLHVGEGME